MDNNNRLDDLDLLDAELSELDAFDDIDALNDLDLDSSHAAENKPERTFEDVPDTFEDDFDEPQFDDDFDEPEVVQASSPVPPQRDTDEKLNDPEPLKETDIDETDFTPAVKKKKPKTTGAGGFIREKGFDPKKIAMGVIILLLLVLCIVLLCNTCSCGSCGKNDKVILGAEDFFDEEAKEGFLPTLSEEEIQAELDRIVEEGMFNVSIGSVLDFKDANSKAVANIENIPANRYYMSVDITLDDTGETVYSSKGIKPGQYIDEISLSKALAPGEYPATARFTAYQPDTYEVEGHVAVKIYIYVES